MPCAIFKFIDHRRISSSLSLLYCELNVDLFLNSEIFVFQNPVIFFQFASVLKQRIDSLVRIPALPSSFAENPSPFLFLNSQKLKSNGSVFRNLAPSQVFEKKKEEVSEIEEADLINVKTKRGGKKFLILSPRKMQKNRVLK